MELVPGETLQQRLDRTGPLETVEVVEIGRQIAEGLAAAHGAGLIHRDIKPANILIEAAPHPRIKITDFGVARAPRTSSPTEMLAARVPRAAAAILRARPVPRGGSKPVAGALLSEICGTVVHC